MMSKKMKLIPELRFPEFLNDGEWEKKAFDELFEIGNGRNYTHLVEGEVPVFGSGGYMLSVNDFLYDGESVCIGRKGTINKPMFLTGKFWTVDTLFYTHSFKKCIPKFIFYIFQNINWLRHNEAGGVPSLSKNNIYKIETVVPKVNEQQKIASCLSSLDELIAAHSDKLEALKDHKKGLMQNLFPQKGQKVPNYRFPEFEKNGAWEEERLGDCLLQKPEYGMNAPAVAFSDSLPTYLRITDISEDGNFLSEGKVSVDREVTENDYLSEGDIVLARTGASVGKSYKYRKKDGELVFAGFLIRVKPNPKRLNSELLFQIFFSSSYRGWVRAVSARSGQPGINGIQYSNMPIDLPPKIEEQQKIASCLSALDGLITAQSEKVEQLQQHKKGLMQGLFPNKSEIR